MGDSAPQLRSRRLGEYRFVLIGSFIAVAITSIPYVLGAALATDERVFGGFVYAVEDGYSYLAKMRQGAEGAWLFHLPYSPEQHPGAIFYSFHILLGRIAGILFDGDLTRRLVWVYHAMRWILGFGLLLTIYHFLSALTRDIRVRRLSWLMIAFGGGLGWLLVALGRPYWLGSLPLDFILPEGFTFLVLYGFPHIALARTLLLWGTLSLLGAWKVKCVPMRRGDSRARIRLSHVGPIGCAFASGFLWLLMSLIVPFYVAVAWAVIGAGWLLLSIRAGRPCWREAGAASIAAFISMPTVIYSIWRISTSPIYSTWASQLVMLSPHPIHYIVAYGVPLIFAGFAVKDAWASRGPLWLALAWVGIAPVLVYLPFSAQRRLVEGVQVPLSLLAALGLTKIAGRWSATPSHRSKLALSLVLAILVPSNVMLIAGNATALRGRPSPIFRDRAEVTALDRLSQRVSLEDVVLASYKTGNYLPARVGARVFVGHGPESVRADEKRKLVAQFFDTATEDTWREQLLTEYGIDYVFWGPAERELGAFDPHTTRYLKQVYEADGYSVFRVEW